MQITLHLIRLVLQTLDDIYLRLPISLLLLLLLLAVLKVKLLAHGPLRHRLSQDWASLAAKDELL